MWKKSKLNSTKKCLGAKPTVLFISFLFMSVMFAGIANANESSSQGIKVHGHWEINVINPDGGIAQNIVFENALTPNGMIGLIRLLTGQSRVKRDASGDLYWDLLARVTGVENAPECDTVTGHFEFGAVLADDAPTRASVSIATDNKSFTLSRLMLLPDSCVLADTYSITRVDSGRRDLVDESVDGLDPYDFSASFTLKTLSSPIIVARGQAVSMKITLSFE